MFPKLNNPFQRPKQNPVPGSLSTGTSEATIQKAIPTLGKLIQIKCPFAGKCWFCAHASFCFANEDKVGAISLYIPLPLTFPGLECPQIYYSVLGKTRLRHDNIYNLDAQRGHADWRALPGRKGGVLYYNNWIWIIRNENLTSISAPAAAHHTQSSWTTWPASTDSHTHSQPFF